MESFRKLKVFGKISTNTKYTITINGEEFTPYNGEELFNFSTSTQLHGGIKVGINVQEGEVRLEKCLVTYPAILNGINGTLTVIQPMEEPVAIIEDGTIRSIPIEGIEIHSGETFEYHHLMFNGPSTIVVETEGHDIFPDVDIYAGDLLQNDIVDGITSIDHKYDYSDMQPNNIFNKSDFENLKQIILANLDN